MSLPPGGAFSLRLSINVFHVSYFNGSINNIGLSATVASFGLTYQITILGGGMYAAKVGVYWLFFLTSTINNYNQQNILNIYQFDVSNATSGYQTVWPTVTENIT
jgi:hypothetical protein